MALSNLKGGGQNTKGVQRHDVNLGLLLLCVHFFFFFFFFSPMQCSYRDFGTVLTIDQHRRANDGRYHLTCIGSRRFRVRGREENLCLGFLLVGVNCYYLTGLCRFLMENPGAKVPAQGNLFF